MGAEQFSPPVQFVLDFFEYAHLPPHLQAASKPFHDLAVIIAQSSSNQETTVALRHLLAAKDSAVRAALVESRKAKT
jgi:hypothetical protein